MEYQTQDRNQPTAASSVIRPSPPILAPPITLPFHDKETEAGPSNRVLPLPPRLPLSGEGQQGTSSIGKQGKVSRRVSSESQRYLEVHDAQDRSEIGGFELTGVLRGYEQGYGAGETPGSVGSSGQQRRSGDDQYQAGLPLDHDAPIPQIENALEKSASQAIPTKDSISHRIISDEKSNTLLNLPPPPPFRLSVDGLCVGVPDKGKVRSYVFRVQSYILMTLCRFLPRFVRRQATAGTEEDVSVRKRWILKDVSVACQSGQVLAMYVDSPPIHFHIHHARTFPHASVIL